MMRMWIFTIFLNSFFTRPIYEWAQKYCYQNVRNDDLFGVTKIIGNTAKVIRITKVCYSPIEIHMIVGE